MAATAALITVEGTASADDVVLGVPNWAAASAGLETRSLAFNDRFAQEQTPTENWRRSQLRDEAVTCQTKVQNGATGIYAVSCCRRSPCKRYPGK